MNEDERPGMGALLKQMKERLEAWRYQWAVCPACSQSPHTRECVLLATINDIEHAQHQHLARRRDEPAGEPSIALNYTLGEGAAEDMARVKAALTDRRAAEGGTMPREKVDRLINAVLLAYGIKNAHLTEALADALEPDSGAGERGDARKTILRIMREQALWFVASYPQTAYHFANEIAAALPQGAGDLCDCGSGLRRRHCSECAITGRGAGERVGVEPDAWDILERVRRITDDPDKCARDPFGALDDIYRALRTLTPPADTPASGDAQ